MKRIKEHTWCSGKIVFFFTIHCNPSHIPYWLVIFCTTNSSRVLARERWQTVENSWKEKQYSMNTLYYSIICPLQFR